MTATFVTGSLSYGAGYLLMGHIRYAVCAMLVTVVAVTAYLVLCALHAEERERHE